MLIDVHGHYTTAPPGLRAYREAQLKEVDNPSRGTLNVTDDESRETIVGCVERLVRVYADIA